jgi:tetratricopeptide (TPR) repeat protein
MEVPDPHRVAEIIVVDSEGKGRRGSGYLVTDRSILTAAHVVVGATTLRVRFDADRPGEWSASATIRWCDLGTDLAVVVLADMDGRQALLPALYGRFGDRSGDVPIRTAGFPLWKVRLDLPGGVFRDFLDASGTVSVLSNRRSGWLELTVTPPAPWEYLKEELNARSIRESPWQGMSGAAVWADGRIVGVVIRHHESEGLQRLTAVRIDRCLEEAGASYRLLAELLGTAVHTASELPEVVPPGATHPMVMRTLPRDTLALLGRDEQLTSALTSIESSLNARTAIPIQTVDGMPGVGKTAFAVHLGHLLADRFPDGQLFIDLHGHTHGRPPVVPRDALATLLNADGVPASSIPASGTTQEVTDVRSGLWRSRVAGRRILLILDNAESNSQVEPLIPGTAGCLVIVTSRHSLPILNANLIPLSPLSPEDATSLLARLSNRTGEDPEEGMQLAKLCGHLPLAISLVAARLRHHPAWQIVDLVAELTSGPNRVDRIKLGEISLRAVFELSYRDLSAPAKKLFRLLSQHPGAEFDTLGAAALIGTRYGEAAAGLEELYLDRLLEESTPGRYRMHDLIRDYAATLVRRHQAAVHRLANFYLLATEQADREITPRAPGVRQVASRSPDRPELPAMPDRSAALAWLRLEVSNVLAAAEAAQAKGWHRDVIRFSSASAGFLRQAGPWFAAMDLHQAAVISAQQIDDHRGEAAALLNLGIVKSTASEYSNAREILARAVLLHEEIPDRHGLVSALNAQGVLFRRTEEGLSGAIKSHSRALSIATDSDDLSGRLKSLTYLGVSWYMSGSYARAQKAAKDASRIARGCQDRFSEAFASALIGALEIEKGNYAEATKHLNDAHRLYDEIGHRHGQAETLVHLAIVQYRTGSDTQAVTVIRGALRIYLSLGARQGEAAAYLHLGVSQRIGGDYEDATSSLHRALMLYRELEHKRGVCTVQIAFGDLLYDRSQRADARDRYRSALATARELTLPLEEAHSLTGIGYCAISSGKTATGLKSLRKALAIYRHMGAVRGEEVAAVIATHK